MTYLNTMHMDEKADGLEMIVIPVTIGISLANGTNKQLPVLYFPDNPRIMKKNILLINGPNLNLLGMREPETYGTQTLQDLEKMCLARSQELGMELTAFQTNHEGAIVDAIQQAKGTYTHIVINPGAYTHTSIAIRDAIIGVDAKVYEVHISDIHSREKFRHHSYISDIAQAVFAGQGLPGYIAAIDRIAKEA